MTSRLITIDIVRIFAAAVVMLFHLGFWAWAVPGSTPGRLLQGAASFPELSGLWWGRFGVEIFFVISGFVIAFSASQSSLPHFISSRFFRLFPTAAICATSTFFALWIADARPADELLSMYSRTLMFHPIGPWVDGVYWTLAIEVVFYMMVSVVIACRQTGKLEIVCIALGVYSSAFWISYLLGYFPQIFDRYAMLALCTHGVYFGLGALIWSAASGGWSAVRTLFAIWFIIVGYTAIILTTPGTTAFVPDDTSPHLPAVIWLCTVLLIIASPLVEKAVRGRLPKRLLEVINFAGLSTYALYLIHDAVGAIIIKDIVGFGAGRWTALLVAILAVISFAVIVTRWVEPPIRKLLKEATSKLGLTARHT